MVYGINAHEKGIREAENSREGLGAPPRTAENTACRTRQRPFLLYGCILKGHPEFSSGSHREPSLILLRGQMLKFAIKREQSQACLNYAEREQIEQR